MSDPAVRSERDRSRRPDQAAPRPARAGEVKQGRRPQRQRRVLDRTEHDGILRPVGSAIRAVCATSAVCPIYWWQNNNNKYSVSAGAVGRPVEIHAYADRIVVRQDGRIVAEHRRSYSRGETIYD